MNRFEGQAAMVTGGAQGIGREIARRLVAEGARVMVFDLEGELAAETANELGDDDRAVAVGGDVGSREDVRRAVRKCVERFGRLDVMFAHAGIADVKPLLEIEDHSWRRIMDVNVTGVFLCTQEAGRAMAEAGRGGAIVVTASTNSFWVEQNLSHYNTSKGAVVAFVRSAALDLAPHKIRVNAVAPGVVNTRISRWVIDDPDLSSAYLEKIPLRRFAEAEDVADVALFLASEASSYITGQSIVVDGGQTLGVPLSATDVSIPGATGEAP